MSDDNSFGVVFGNRTDLGKVRKRNEDYMECFKSPFGEVFVVCDGMGGHEGGEIASRLAVATIRQIITTNLNGLTSPASIIEESMGLANRAVISKSHEVNGLKGMGTTSVVLIVKDNQAFYGHVGDSRLYLVRGNTLYLMTRDHSFVQGLIDQGLIGWEEAESHPRKNEITQALGIFDNINPEVNHKALQLYKGDKFILCSDGLTGPVPEDKILELVSKYPPMEASNALVEAANNNGGPDNITVQIIEITNAETLPQDKMAIPPEGAIDRSSMKTNAKIRDFRNPSSDSNTFSKKKRNVIPYIAIGAAIIIITGLIVLNPFTGKNQLKPSLSDSMKTKDSSQSSELQAISRELEPSLRELYRGKSTPSMMPGNLTLSKRFEYLGILDDSVRNYDRVGLVKNIINYDLKFDSLFVIHSEDSLNYSAEMKISFEGKLHTFKIKFRTKDGKSFELQSIKCLKEKNIQKENVKKDTGNKDKKKKTYKDPTQEEKSTSEKKMEGAKPKENLPEKDEPNEKEGQPEDFGK